MGALGKPSLITWTSLSAVKEDRKPKFIRVRTIGYAIALTIALIGLMLMSTKKEYMLLNINRTTELYKIKPDGRVENAYTFLFQNTQPKSHKYYFEVVDHPEIKILRPKKPFNLKHGKKVKKIIILSTDKILVKDSTKDTPIKIKIHAFALEDNNKKSEKISVYRDTIFVFPRYDIYKEKTSKK